MLEQCVKADSYLVAVALKVVVKGELGVGRYGLGGEEANGDLTALHHPLLCLTVGLTRVVDESAQRSLQAQCWCVPTNIDSRHSTIDNNGKITARGDTVSTMLS